MSDGLQIDLGSGAGNPDYLTSVYAYRLLNSQPFDSDKDPPTHSSDSAAVCGSN